MNGTYMRPLMFDVMVRTFFSSSDRTSCAPREADVEEEAPGWDLDVEAAASSLRLRLSKPSGGIALFALRGVGTLLLAAAVSFAMPFSFSALSNASVATCADSKVRSFHDLRRYRRANQYLCELFLQ